MSKTCPFCGDAAPHQRPSYAWRLGTLPQVAPDVPSDIVEMLRACTPEDLDLVRAYLSHVLRHGSSGS